MTNPNRAVETHVIEEMIDHLPLNEIPAVAAETLVEIAETVGIVEMVEILEEGMRAEV